MAITQKNREIGIGIPLGEDVLLLKSMSGTEQLGRPFEFQLELASEDHQINSADIVGQNVTIRLDLLAKNETRYFNGFISRFSQVPGSGGLASYRATVVPWLWFLTRTADCRIFQEKTVRDIIKEVFGELGFTDVEDALTGSYPTWEFCVQYRETDFNFVSRLMEQEGIYYFFKHEDGKHTLVLADSASAHESYLDYYDQIEYEPAGGAVSDEEYISDLTVDTRVQPGRYALNDFDFKATKKNLLVRSNMIREHTKSDYEIYDYPGEYTESGDGNDYAKKRIEELQAQHEVVTAASDARGICTGCTFTLSKHPRDDRNRKYLITSANYNIDAGEFYSGEGGGKCVYSCSFTAIDAKQPFRAARITPKPSIPGPQTAMVVGPSGEEIYTDPDGYGRVKVQFHWDRQGKVDENSSCWIRVAQVWAGKQWGAMYIPRIGQEVIVEFLEGDPDHPIITGRVYNGQAMPPYDLPSEKTKSTLKSNSSKGGQGFNEIRLEDKKGEEQLFIHAEKDEDIVVENNKTEMVGSNETIDIGNDRTETVGNDETLTVVKNRSRSVGENETITVALTRTHTVGVNEAITIGAAQEVTVGAARTVTVGASQSVNIGANLKESIGKDYSIAVGKNLGIAVKEKGSISVSKDFDMGTEKTLTIKAKESLVIESEKDVTIRAGKAQVVLKKDGKVEVKGSKINIKGSGDVKIKGSKIAMN